MNRAEIKAKAKDFAFNNKWNIWKPSIIYGAVYAVLMCIMVVITYVFKLDAESAAVGLLDIALGFVMAPLTVGSTYYLLKLVNGKKVDVTKDLFSKYSIIGLIILTSLYVGLMTTLWSLLLIVPGIIYAYKVAMIQYVLAEDGSEKKSVKEIVATSTNLMDGYKMDFFTFELSFIGWILLGMVTFGIAYIWVFPYMEVANVMYYEELKKIKKIK